METKWELVLGHDATPNDAELVHDGWKWVDTVSEGIINILRHLEAGEVEDDVGSCIADMAQDMQATLAVAPVTVP